MPAIVRCRRPPRPTEFPRPNLPHLSRPGRRRGRAGGRRCAKGPPRYTIGQGGSSRSKWAHTLAWTRSGMKWTCRSTMPGSPSEATYAATSWSRRAGGASMPPSLPADPAGASRECRPRRTCWGRQAGRAGGHRRMAASLRERWRRPPRLRTVGAEDEERHATWLELFFDLVFVICIAEVVHTLEDDRSLGGFLGTAGLFVPIWWAWLGYTVYADRFDTDDLLHRVLVLAGMLAVIAMALSVHDALHGGSAQFALAYVAVRVVVLVLEPYRYLLWAVGMAVELSAPWLGRRRMARAPIHASHMTERFGLFTLIVIGESVISVAQGAAGVDWEPRTLAVAVVGFLAVASLWWIYFEYVGALAIRSVLDGLCFTYAHLPLLAGLVSVAVGTDLAVVQAAAGGMQRAIATALGGGTALYLLALTAIHATTGHAIGDRVLWLRLGSAAVALAVGAFGPLGAPLGLVGLLAALLVVHVAVEMALRHQAASEAPPDVPTATGPTLP